MDSDQPFRGRGVTEPPFVDGSEVATNSNSSQGLFRSHNNPAGRLMPGLPGIERDPCVPERPDQYQALPRAPDVFAPCESEQRRLLNRGAGLLVHLPVKGCPPVLSSFGSTLRNFPENARPRHQNDSPFRSEADPTRAVGSAFRRGKPRRMPRRNNVLASTVAPVDVLSVARRVVELILGTQRFVLIRSPGNGWTGCRANRPKRMAVCWSPSLLLGRE